MSGPPGLLESEHTAYWTAVSEADERSAQAVVGAALARGVPVETALELVVGAQLRVGALWAANEWSVSHEHAATAIGEAVVRRLISRLCAPEDGPGLLVACVEREWHALPALVVTAVLKARWTRVHYLGANASRELLVAEIVDRGPRAVLLSASLASSLPKVRNQVETIRGTGTPVIVGGRAFDADGVRAGRLGATAYAADPLAVPELLAALPRHVPPAPPLVGAAAGEAGSLHAEAEDISHDVEAVLRSVFGVPADPHLDRDDWRVVLTTFVPHVVDCLAGALLTGDAGLLVETRDWLSEVLTGRDGAPEAVPVLWRALRGRVQGSPKALRMLADL